MQRIGVLVRFSGKLERGGAAALVAILLGAGVVMGFAALTIDVGSLMFERRQLQNGADASALAMARTCAVDATKCVADPAVNQADLVGLNSANAKDTEHGFDASTFANGLCGRANLLPACGGGITSDLTECPTLPSSVAANANIPYVEVHTETKAADGTSILPTWLVRTLAGGSTGTTVKSCARAAYGAPGPTAVSAPITFSMCEWRFNSGNGASYVQDDPQGVPGYGASPLPPWPSAATTPPTAGGEIVITLQGGPHDPAACPNWNGHDVAGGFGYLAANGCNATVSQDSWVQIDTGNSLPSGCDIAPFHGRVIYLPVFDCVMRSLSQPSGAPPTAPADVCDYGTGNNTWYHIAGWAKFYLSGYKVGGSDERASLVSGQVPCTGGDRCISGWFLEGVLRDAPVAGPPPLPGSPGFGTYAIQPAG